MKTKAQASGLLERNLSFEFRPIAWPIFMKKKITYKFRMATEKIEEEKINLNDATEIIEAMKKLFERTSENEVKNFHRHCKSFPEREKSIQKKISSDIIVGDLHHLVLTAKLRVKSRSQGFQFYRQYFRILLERLTTMMGDNLRAYRVKFQPFWS